MKLHQGARLGPYEIVAPLGAGGMGEVYRARDTRLGRTVAVKILPAEFANDARLRARLEREAKAISALNHPHICTLHDLGSDQGVEYLVLEYCEGRTLAARTAEGPLPLPQVLDYGMQIADALERAHRQGIIHRDLKPSNVMLTKSGVKLLDFGLAKRRPEALPAGISQTATRQEAVSEDGVILGTVQYMAPEVLQGREADARSDVFALGLVLYEMVTGRPAFAGASKASVIAHLLDHDPAPISEIRPAVPPALDRVIRACLTKDPDDRLQTAHDVMLQLRWIAEGLASAPVSQGQPRRRHFWLAWSAAGVGLAAATLVVLFQLIGDRTPPPVGLRRFSIQMSPALPSDAFGASERFDVSPDGSRLVFVSDYDGVARLYLKHLNRPDASRIDGTDGARSPFFSPDGRWIGFYGGGSLKKVSAEGGGPLTICDIPNVPRGASWGPDDTIVLGLPGGPLQRVSAAGGVLQPITVPGPEENHRWPSFLPGGDRVLFTVADRSGDYARAKIAVLTLQSGEWQTVWEGGTRPRFAAGHLLYSLAGVLFVVPVDPRSLQVAGTPLAITDDVYTTHAAGTANYTVSGDGTVFYLPRDPQTEVRELLWVDRAGNTTLATPRRDRYAYLAVSPDGKQLLAGTEDGRGRVDAWLADLDRDAWTRLTSEGSNLYPIWSPDQRQVGFSSNRSGRYNFYVMPADRSGPATQMTNRANFPFGVSWSSDGRLVALYEQHPETRSDLWILDVTRREAKPFMVSPFVERLASFSPDGRWLAYESNETGRFDIHVRPYPGPGPDWVISTDGGTEPRWPRSGKELFYRNGNKMVAVDVAVGDQFVAGRPRVLFEMEFHRDAPDDWSYDVTADGQRFVALRRVSAWNPTHLNVILGALDARGGSH